MSTWTSKAAARAAARAAALAAACALAACVAAGGGGGAVPFLGGAVQAAAPAGYCIDRAASHDEGDGAVVLIGKCRGESAATPALITVSIGGPGSSAVLQSGARALSDYFLTQAGRAALARDGRAGSVQVRQTVLAEGVLLLRIADRNVGEYWRAVLGLRGRLVTISVTPPEGGTLEAADGRVILDRTISAMRRVNAASSG